MTSAGTSIGSTSVTQFDNQQYTNQQLKLQLALNHLFHTDNERTLWTYKFT
jgi:hypothetical protein